MKQLNLIISLFFFVFLFNSCQDNKSPDNIIHIDVDKISSISASDWFSSMELVSLETKEQSLLNKCYKMEYYHGRYYIHDLKQHAAFVFDSIGSFLFSTLFYKGHGPQEYLSMTDLTINPSSGNMEILDSSARKIIVFSKEGKPIKSIKLPNSLMPLGNFISLPDDLYVFYSPDYTRDKNCLKVFSVKENKIIREMLPLDETTDHLVITNTTLFYWYNDSVYFSHPFSNNDVYQIDKNLNIRKLYSYDYGAYTFNYKDLPKNEDKRFYRRFDLENKERYAFTYMKYETSRFRFCFFTFKEKQYIARFDKNNGQQQTISHKFKDEGMVLPPMLIDDQFIYNVAEPSWLPYMVNRGLLSQKDQEKIRKVKEDDNPVIIKYKLKK